MIADALYVGDTSVGRVMLGDVEVWSAAPVTPDLPVVTITGTSGNTSRNQFRAACVEYGTTYQTVTELPFLLDTSAATDLGNLLFGCSALTHVPDMDTTNVTSMSRMFYNCSSLTSAPSMNTVNVTSMANMFSGCSSLAHVPDMDTSQVESVTSMFLNCSMLTDGNVRLIGKHPSVNTLYMIDGSGLTREPFYDTAGNPI